MELDPLLPEDEIPHLSDDDVSRLDAALADYQLDPRYDEADLYMTYGGD